MTEQTTMRNPNRILWESYQQAFNYFNEQLFDNALPKCILSFAATGKSLGFFRDKRWKVDEFGDLPEISLNPILLTRQDDLIFQVLVKNMVQLWQQTFGTPPNKEFYYNIEFTEKMADLGLPCTPDYGYSINFEVDENGSYSEVKQKAVQQFFPLTTTTVPTHFKAPQKRVLYVCPECSFKAYATAGGKLICNTHDCNAEMDREIEEKS